MGASPCESEGLTNVIRGLLNKYTRARAYATVSRRQGLAPLSVRASEGISEPPCIPKEGKSSFPPLPFPPLLYPIFYSILDPITRLLWASKHRRKRNPLFKWVSLASLCLCPCVYHLLPTEGFGSSDKQRKHHRDSITKAKDTRHTHTHKHIYTEEHSKEAVFVIGLPSESDAPFALEGNKLNNLTVLHRFCIQDTGGISSLRKHCAQWKDFKGGFVPTFLGNAWLKPCYLAEPQHAWRWQTRGIQGCGTGNKAFKHNLYFILLARGHSCL